MPSKFKSLWTLNSLIQISNQVAFNRLEYAFRDIPKSAIQIKKVNTYNGKNPESGSKTLFYIQSHSWPQYAPFYTRFDKKGRTRVYQRSVKHIYQVIIKMDYLNINAPVQLRTGTNKKPVTFVSSNLIKSKKNPYGLYLSLGDFIAKFQGINLDHYYRQEHIRAVEGCLFGKDLCGSTPSDVKTPWLTKHEWRVIEVLLEQGILSK